jgi:hypothetical protein
LIKFRKSQMRLRINVINISKILRTYKKLWASRELRSFRISKLLRIIRECKNLIWKCFSAKE